MPKTLFIDSTPDIDKVWKQVHGARGHPDRRQHGPGGRAGRAGQGRGLRHGDQRCDLLQRADARALHGPEAHRLPRHRRGELRRHRGGRRSSASRSRPSAATATRPWPSMRWGWSSPLPATSPPCTASCAAAAGGRCRAWSCAARRWASSDWAASAREMARIAGGIGLKVIAYNRTPRPGTVALDELLASRTSSACISA